MRRWVILSSAILVWLLIAVVFIGTPGKGQTRAQGGATATTDSVMCDRTLINLVTLLKRDHKFNPIVRTGAPDYCSKLEAEANAFAERLLATPDASGILIESNTAFAFIDFAARQYVGTIPKGVTMQAVARNTLPGSQMIFVVGNDFTVFVDYTFTTLAPEKFDTLPDYREYSGPIQPRCEASWCQAPGPRPTATK